MSNTVSIAARGGQEEDGKERKERQARLLSVVFSASDLCETFYFSSFLLCGSDFFLPSTIDSKLKTVRDSYGS